MWSNENAAKYHPRSYKTLVHRPNDRGGHKLPGLNPQIRIDSKSPRRVTMFEKFSEKLFTDTSAQRLRTSLPKAYHQAVAAAGMHVGASPERAFNSAYHMVKPHQTLPYKTAGPMAGRIPTPQAPVGPNYARDPRAKIDVRSPKIGGVPASAILRGTGAMSVAPKPTGKKMPMPKPPSSAKIPKPPMEYTGKAAKVAKVATAGSRFLRPIPVIGTAVTAAVAATAATNWLVAKAVRDVGPKTPEQKAVRTPDAARGYVSEAQKRAKAQGKKSADIPKDIYRMSTGRVKSTYGGMSGKIVYGATPKKGRTDFSGTYRPPWAGRG